MIIAFTGAGISKASGISTFDESGDLRKKLDRRFAKYHRSEFREVMKQLEETCSAAQPNDAHYALAEYKIPVITMNIDSLHSRAGSEHILAVHGSLKMHNVVLYGDSAPLYSEALDWIDRMDSEDILLIIGTSFYTSISSQIKAAAEKRCVNVVVINDDAEHNVRSYLEEHKDFCGDFYDFIKREPAWMTDLRCYSY